MGDIGQSMSAAANLAATQMTNDANKEIANKYNALQEKLFNQGNQFSASEAEKARQFNASESLNQFERQQVLNQQSYDFNASESEKARRFEQEMYEKFESPEALAGAFQRAGINPGAALSGSNGSIASVGAASGSSGAASAASGSGVSSMSVPHMIAPQYESPMGALVDGYIAMQNSSAQAAEAKSKANLNNIDAVTRRSENEANIRKSLNEAYKAKASGELDEKKKDETDRQIKSLENQLDLFEKTKAFQVASSEADAKIKGQQLKIMTVDALMKEFDWQIYSLSRETEQQLNEAQIESLKAHGRAAMIQAVSADYSSKTGRMSLNFDKNKWENTMNGYFKAETKRLRSETSKNKSQKDLIDQQYNTELEREEQVSADTKRIKAETQNIKKKTHYMDQENARSWIKTTGDVLGKVIPF